MDLIGKRFRILKLNLFLFGTVLLVSFSLFALNRELSSVEINKLEANIKSDPTNIKSRRFLVNHYYKAQQWPELINVGFPIQDKLSADELLKLVEALIAIRQDDNAIATLKFYHNNNKPSPRSKYLEGLATTITASKEKDKTRQTNFINAASDSFKESIKLNPKQEDAYQGWIALVENHINPPFEEVLQIYRRMEDALGDVAKFYSHKCGIYYKASYLEQATEMCTLAINKHPKIVENYIYLGLTNADLNNEKEAKKYYLIAVKKFPESFLAQKTLADFYFSKKNCLDATKHYSLALRIDAKAAESYLGLAECLYQLQQYEPALVAFRRNCYYSQKISSQFRSALGGLRPRPSLHKKYERAIASCKVQP